MAGKAEFSVAFEIASTDQDRLDAFALYEKALGAKLIDKFNPGEGAGNLHIMMEIGGVEILLHPSGEQLPAGVVGCQVEFETEEEVRRAYELMTPGALEHSLASWPHAPYSALITDRYGVRWWIHN
jgi:uncharacterized glyoxalase superfamily protein PhnB